MRSLVLFLFVLVSFRLSADIAPDPENYSGADLCDIIENAETYEAKAISTFPGGKTTEYTVKNNKCLNVGYKFSKLSIRVNGKVISGIPDNLGQTFAYLKRPTTTVAAKRVFRIEPVPGKSTELTLKSISRTEYQTAQNFEHAPL